MTHAEQRVRERLTDAGWSSDKIERFFELVCIYRTEGDTAVLFATLPARVNEAWGDRSNGNQVWGIYRAGECKTVMLRRSTQPATTEALRVDNLVFLGR